MSAVFSFYVLGILTEGFIYPTSCHRFSVLMIICSLGTNVQRCNFAKSSFFLSFLLSLLLLLMIINNNYYYFDRAWIDGLLY